MNEILLKFDRSFTKEHTKLLYTLRHASKYTTKLLVNKSYLVFSTQHFNTNTFKNEEDEAKCLETRRVGKTLIFFLVQK